MRVARRAGARRTRPASVPASPLRMGSAPNGSLVRAGSRLSAVSWRAFSPTPRDRPRYSSRRSMAARPLELHHRSRSASCRSPSSSTPRPRPQDVHFNQLHKKCGVAAQAAAVLPGRRRVRRARRHRQRLRGRQEPVRAVHATKSCTRSRPSARTRSTWSSSCRHELGRFHLRREEPLHRPGQGRRQGVQPAGQGDAPHGAHRRRALPVARQGAARAAAAVQEGPDHAPGLLRQRGALVRRRRARAGSALQRQRGRRSPIS